ncbi:MAG: insulinase family protein [Acidobacteriota bacterium]
MRWPVLLLFASELVASSVAEPLSSVSLVAQAPAYSRAFESRDDQANLTRVKLRNGLTVIIEEHPVGALASVLTFVRGGYALEDDAGISQLLDRLYLHRSQALLEMGELGAVLDVRTDYWGASLVSSAPAENVLKILEHHSGLLRAPQIDPAGVSPEVQVMLAQQAGWGNSSGSFARERLQEMIGPDGRDGNGLPLEGLSALFNTDSTLQKLSDYHRAVYHPGNTLVVISGAVRRENILEKVVELYGSMKPDPEAVQASMSEMTRAPSLGTAFQYRHLRGDTQRPHILFGYRLPGPQHEDYLPLVLLSYILGEGRGGLLKKALLGADGSALDVQLHLENRGPRSVLLVVVNPVPDRVDRAEVQVLAQLEALKQRGVPVSEMDRAKAMLLRDHYEEMESLDQRARLLAWHETLGDYSNRDRFPEMLNRINASDISRVLNRYFEESNLALLEYFPQNAEPRTFDSQTVLETLQLLVETVLNDEAGVLDVLRITDAESVFEATEFTTSYNTQELKYTSVLRGPSVYFQEEHLLPLVHMGFFYFGGRISETSDNAGITQLLLSALLHRALSGEKSMDFSRLRRLGAELEIVNELDFFGFRVTVLSNHLEAVLGTFVDWSRLSGVEEADLEAARREVLAMQAQEQESDREAVMTAARAEVFGGHPYGLSRLGTSETISRVTLEDLETWRAAQLSEVHPLIVVRGDIEGTSFLSDFVSRLSDSDYENRAPLKKPWTGSPDGYESYSDRVVKGPRGRWIMAFPGPATGTKQAAALDVLKVALLGPSGSLSTPLRNRGWVDQLQIVNESGLNGGSLLIHLVSLNGSEESVRETLFNQLTQLGRVPLREQEFLRAVVGAMTRFHIRQQFGKDYLTDLIRNVAVGRGVDTWTRYLTTLRNLRREDLLSLAGKFLREQEPGTGSQETEDRIQEPEVQSPKPEPEKPTVRPPSLRRPE